MIARSRVSAVLLLITLVVLPAGNQIASEPNSKSDQDVRRSPGQAGTSRGTVETVVRPDTVLVAGNPALTEDLVNRTSGYFAWLLETPITKGQSNNAEVIGEIMATTRQQ
jgi:hypothetical protein